MQDNLAIIPITNLYLINQNYSSIPSKETKIDTESNYSGGSYNPKKEFIQHLRSYVASELGVTDKELPETLKVEVSKQSQEKNLKVIDYFSGEILMEISGSILDEWNQKNFMVKGFLVDRWA